MTDSERTAEVAAIEAAYAVELGAALAQLINALEEPPNLEPLAPPRERYRKGLALLRAARRVALEVIAEES